MILVFEVVCEEHDLRLEGDQAINVRVFENGDICLIGIGGRLLFSWRNVVDALELVELVVKIDDSLVDRLYRHALLLRWSWCSSSSRTSLWRTLLLLGILLCCGGCYLLVLFR